jgi:hypothetical protein
MKPLLQNNIPPPLKQQVLLQINIKMVIRFHQKGKEEGLGRMQIFHHQREESVICKVLDL